MDKAITIKNLYTILAETDFSNNSNLSIEELTKIIDKHLACSNKINEKTAEADENHKNGRYNEALACYDELLQQLFPEARNYAKILAHHLENEHKKAANKGGDTDLLKMLTKFKETDDTFEKTHSAASAYLGRGAIKHKLGMRDEDILNDFKEALKLNPRSETAQKCIALSERNVALKRDNEEGLKQLKDLKEKQEELERKKIEHDASIQSEVFKKMRQIIEDFNMERNNSMEYLKNGMQKSEQNLDQDALLEFDKAIQSENSLEIKINKLDELVNALSNFNSDPRVVDMLPKFREMINTHKKQNRTTQALIYLHRGISYMELGRTKAARADYDKARELNMQTLELALKNEEIAEEDGKTEYELLKRSKEAADELVQLIKAEKPEYEDIDTSEFDELLGKNKPNEASKPKDSETECLKAELKRYKTIGTPEDLKKAAEQAKEMEDLERVTRIIYKQRIDAAIKTIKDYKSELTPEEIKKMFGLE